MIAVEQVSQTINPRLWPAQKYADHRLDVRAIHHAVAVQVGGSDVGGVSVGAAQDIDQDGDVAQVDAVHAIEVAGVGAHQGSAVLQNNHRPAFLDQRCVID